MNILLDLKHGIVAKIEYDYGQKTDLKDKINCECLLKVERITFLKERYFHDADNLTIEQFNILSNEINKINKKIAILKIDDYNKRLPF